MAEGDFNKPSSTSTKLGFMTEIREMFATLAKMNGSGTNPPADYIKYNSANKRREKYNGSTWAALDVTGESVGYAASSFPSGTRMLFAQTAAPTGWTKETGAAYNDAALRVVTGSVVNGGATAFSSVFNNSQAVAVTVNVTSVSVTVNSHTLTLAEIPAHSHITAYSTGGGSTLVTLPVNAACNPTAPMSTSSVGGSGGHNHTASGSGTATGSGSFTIPNLKYADIVIATKD